MSKSFDRQAYDHICGSSLPPERLAEIYNLPLKVVHEIQMGTVDGYHDARIRARNSMVQLQELTTEEIQRMELMFQKLDLYEINPSTDLSLWSKGWLSLVLEDVPPTVEVIFADVYRVTPSQAAWRHHERRSI